jgi:ankyrin repeat protein
MRRCSIIGLTVILISFIGRDGIAQRSSEDSILLAASKCDVVRVRELVKKGISVDSTEFNGDTVLMHAVEVGCSDLVDFLLESGADVNKKANYGGTALMTSALFNRAVLTARLLKAGAGINVVDNKGWTTLTVATTYNSEQVFKLLIDSGAKIDVPDSRNETLLMKASHYPNLARILINMGADVNARNDGGATALFYASRETIELLVNAGAKVDERDKLGGTTLMWACEAGQIDRVNKLISVGADVNAKDAAGRSVLNHSLNPQETDNVIPKEIRDGIISAIRNAGGRI